MQPSTSAITINIVVCTLSAISLIGVAALAFCSISNITPETTLLTAFVGITTGSIAGLTALLANTRTSPPPVTATEVKTETTTTETHEPK